MVNDGPCEWGILFERWLRVVVAAGVEEDTGSSADRVFFFRAGLSSREW